MLIIHKCFYFKTCGWWQCNSQISPSFISVATSIGRRKNFYLSESGLAAMWWEVLLFLIVHTDCIILVLIFLVCMHLQGKCLMHLVTIGLQLTGLGNHQPLEVSFLPVVLQKITQMFRSKDKYIHLQILWFCLIKLFVLIER